MADNLKQLNTVSKSSYNNTLDKIKNEYPVLYSHIEYYLDEKTDKRKKLALK